MPEQADFGLGEFCDRLQASLPFLPELAQPRTVLLDGPEEQDLSVL